MPEVMLRPGWPGAFNRTIRVDGDEPRLVTFQAGIPVEVTDAELAFLKPDLEKSIFEIERDVKGRARFVESSPTPSAEPLPTVEAGSNSAKQPDSKKAKRNKVESVANV